MFRLLFNRCAALIFAGQGEVVRNLVDVEVAPAHDDANLFTAQIELVVHRRRGRQAAGRLNHHFHPFHKEAHLPTQLDVTDRQDTFDIFLNDREDHTKNNLRLR